jgi:hypothetical protein
VVARAGRIKGTKAEWRVARKGTEVREGTKSFTRRRGVMGVFILRELDAEAQRFFADRGAKKE